MAEITFNIKVQMSERWVDDFCSMLKYMEHCGNIGHTAFVEFCSDGDGDFRPKFEFSREYEPKEGCRRKNGADLPDPEVLFDAGIRRAYNG